MCGGFFKVTAGRAGPIVTDYPKVLEVIKREVPELDFAVPRGRGWAKSSRIQAQPRPVSAESKLAMSAILRELCNFRAAPLMT